MTDKKYSFEVKNMPLYKKGEEIFDVVQQIGDLIPEDNMMLQEIKGWMFSDVTQLCVKVAGAEAGDLYDIRMEAAAIIRKSAMDLMIQNHSLKAYGFKDVQYYQIVRNLIEEYRLLFIDWVAGFDKENYIIDRWGLFNPTGVGPFDKDPGDDIPFNPDDFLGDANDDDED